MTELLRRNRPLLVAVVVVVVVLVWMSRTYEPKVTASILLSGLTLAALYFMVSSGLSLIFGLMDVLNFAHGTLFMSGAYFGYTLYANPRMLLNTLPFLLALAGGALMGRTGRRGAWAWLARAFGVGHERLLAGLGLAVAAALVVAGVWGFNILALAANSATAAGGAVATAVAQEAAGRFMLRLALLGSGGVVFGLLRPVGLRPAHPGEQRGDLALGAVLVGLAFVMVPARTAGEALILALSSNVRFVLALALGAGLGALFGALIEWGLIRPLYVRPLYQVLVTLGLVYVGTEAIKGVWGPAGFYMDIPAFFNTKGGDCPSPNLIAWFRDHCASIDVLGRPFPSYRLFIIFLGVAMFFGILLLLRRTRLGMIIRAGVQDSDMVQALGIDVRRVFTLVFALGTALSTLGGVAAAPFIGVNLGIGADFQLQAFISIVIGGMGSFPGAAMGALLVGLARAFGDQFVLGGVQLPGMAEAVKLSPSIARASTVLIMALVLMLRPAGLFGKKD